MSTDEFFFIRHSVGQEIGKDFPQSISMERCSPDIVNGVDQLMKYDNKFPDFDPIFGDIILSDNARITDVISSVNFNRFVGFIVNQKFADTIKKLDIYNYKMYPIIVVHLGIKYEYFWMHIVSKEYGIIDFEKSKYAITSALGRKIENVDINSYVEYLTKKSKLDKRFFLTFDYLYLKKDLIRYDWFATGAGLNDFIVSNRLKQALETKGISGISFTPLPQWINFI